MFGATKERFDALEARVLELETQLDTVASKLNTALEQGEAEAGTLLGAVESVRTAVEQLNTQQQQMRRDQVDMASTVAMHSNTFARLLGGLHGVIGQFVTPPETKLSPSGVREESAIRSLPRSSRRQMRRQQVRDQQKKHKDDGSTQAEAQ